VIKRWKFITNSLLEIGITCKYSSDGDPRLLGAMKTLSGFGTPNYLPELGVNLMCNLNSRYQFMQDSYHLGNKLKNRLFDTTIDLELGQFVASVNHLKMLVNNPEVSKEEHCLTISDIDSNDSTRDKMNTKSTQKICTSKVIELLKSKVNGSEGTCAYLQLILSIYKAYIEKETDPLDRLYHAYYVVSFIRRWKTDLGSQSNADFLTSNSWTCIELNFVFLLSLIMNGQGHKIVIFNSQPCEELFRTLRSLSSFGLTEINFSLLEVLEKINRIQILHDIAHDLRENFVLPENEKMKSDVYNSIDVPVYFPRIEECKTTIVRASKDAENICKTLKMKKFTECDPQGWLKPSVSGTSNQQIQNEEVQSEGVVQIKNMHFLEEQSGILVFIFKLI